MVNNRIKLARSHPKNHPNTLIRIGLFGEGMIELSGNPLQRKYGGDVLNTAVYLSRLQLQHPCPDVFFEIQFITALGTDSLSGELIAAWNDEGLNTDLVQRIDNKTPGLYLVETAKNGSSHFHYWRSDSAARHYFNHSPKFLESYLLSGRLDYLYLSGISLAILSAKHRTDLVNLLTRFTQKGGRVIFDNNYRSLLWDAKTARDCYLSLLPIVDTAFLTDADEAMVFGSSSPDVIIERYDALKVREIIIKRGAQPCVVFEGETKESLEVACSKQTDVVDTCAAGDAFAAAYLFNRLSGNSLREAALAGHELASVVIQHPGAIVPPQTDSAAS